VTASGPARWAARWLARLQAVSPILRMAMLSVTGLSTALIGLKQYGYGELARPLIAAFCLLVLAGTYLYAERGVYNQQKRDHVDLGTNFSGPTMRIDDELIGNAVFAAIHGRPPDEDEREAISEAVHEPWADYREGVDLSDD
jgi:hypothetical protein